MRIQAIELTWFRGAADPVSLETGCKSTVVYGSNGSGKSSFVDAIEYVLNDCRIGHLAHEYSGKRQEKAVPNTHKPEDRRTELRVKFKDDSELRTEFAPNGSSKRSGAEAVAMHTWDYRRTVLRQDEVSRFIHDTKGEKYSALLPLLGLQKLDVAADTLRQLAKSVEEHSKLTETRATLTELETRRKATFGTDSDDQIWEKIQELHARYCPEKAATQDAESRCADVKTAIDRRIAESSADQRRYISLQDVAAVKLKDHVDAVRTSSVSLAGAVDPLIAEKLEILQATGLFVDQIRDETEVQCPACGQTISVADFQAHVKSERDRLRDIDHTFRGYKRAIGALCDAVKALKSCVGKPEVDSWRDELARGPLASHFVHLHGIDADALRNVCTEDELKGIESHLLPLIDAAGSAVVDAPRDVQQLSDDKRTVETGQAVVATADTAAAVERTEALVSFIKTLERGVREEIKVRSQCVISDISSDLQAMWSILHPDVKIEGVRLYVPENADKAIDIHLKFHGRDQESPRLTLSEGYRNSLGLCIFLAMAKREADKDRPLFLDDVIVSLDRNHRGMVAELLEMQFSARQVVILTHDREWYSELRKQLNPKGWEFRALAPYEAPGVGIRWAHKTMTFADARAHLADRPDSAGNDARKIMDVELALIAERLQIRMPYQRGDRNDLRGAHDFLTRFITDGKKSLKKRVGDSFQEHGDAIVAFEAADRLLTSWGNKGSHTFDLARSEATKLIDTCEKALESFACPSCSRCVWFAKTDKWLQCGCGEIQWR